MGAKSYVCFLDVVFMGGLYRVWNDILFFWTIYFQFGSSGAVSVVVGGLVSPSPPAADNFLLL